MAAVIENDTPRSIPRMPPIAVLGIFAGALIFLLHPTFVDMAKIWITSSSYHHGAVVAPIAVWMIATSNDPVKAGAVRLPGYLIVAAGALVWLLGRAAGAALVEQLAFVTMIIGGVGVVYGEQALRQWAYPLGFLFFMVPFGETIVPALQTLTAQIVVWLLSLISMPVTLDGYLIETPAGAFEVAEACAGFRFLIAAVMIAAVFSYVSFEGARKRILFLLFAVGLAIVANGLRAFLLVLIATLTQKQWAVGPDHLLFGWVFYAVIFIILIFVGRRYADDEIPGPTVRAQRVAANSLTLLPALAIIGLVSTYSWKIIDRPIERIAPPSLSLFNAPGWRILPPAENWRAHFPNADRTAGATYTNADHTIYLSVGYFTHDRKGREIVSYHNRAWDNQGWRRIGDHRAVIYLFGASQERSLSILAGPERRRLAAITVYWLDGNVYLDRWRLKAAQMQAKLRGENPAGGIVVITAAYQRDPAKAMAALRAFTGDVEPFGAWLIRQNGR